MNHPEELKQLVARAALAYVPAGVVIGVGTGSTVNCFIDALATLQPGIVAAVSSSEATTARLQAHGIAVRDANTVERLAVYIDGADEIDPQGCMIKGGGAALTREKIVADLADSFICIADVSKRVAKLGRFPLPVEVIPMAQAQIARHLRALGGHPVVRAATVTDNGGCIIDVHGLTISDPVGLEAEINQWPGVVAVGLFARQRAHLCLLGTEDGLQTLRF